MKIRIIDNGYTKHSELLKRSIEERIPAEMADGGMTVELSVDKLIGTAESYVIAEKNGTWQITGSDSLGLYYGIGKFLHSAKWTDEAFTPKATDGVSSPDCSFRATYYSVHFHNWYHEAPVEELIRYTEEVLLYGYNTIFCILPVVNLNNFEDEDFRFFREKTRTVYKIAKDLGMKVGTIINCNQGLKTTPAEFDADLSCYDGRTGNGGKNICYHADGALDYLKNIWDNILAQYTDIGLDYVMTWPYDEGGCGCKDCMPWGARGFLDLNVMLHEKVEKLYPDAKFIIATWYFDEKFEGPWDELGEFEGLYKRLHGDVSFADYIMVDSHNSFPHYPIEHRIVRPIVNFPEISMYGVRSWGGRGANPLPKRFQRIWDSSKAVLSGGMPYSEGMYEDISKVQFAGYYWNKELTYKDILGEYISYEYSDKVVDKVIEMMELIEENHVRVRSGLEPLWESAVKAESLAKEADALLPERAKTSWRWRILYIRALIDFKLYKYHFDNCRGKEKAIYELWQTRESYLADDEEAQELLQELCRLYHTVDKEMGKNQWTFPPVKNGKVLKK